MTNIRLMKALMIALRIHLQVTFIIQKFLQNDLNRLTKFATSEPSLIFDINTYRQSDAVGMRSPLSSILANAFCVTLHKTGSKIVPYCLSLWRINATF